MLFMWRLGFGWWANGTTYGGSIMVLTHTGRRSGIRRRTPLNYAIIDGHVYCMAGFGEKCDWYQNIMDDNRVEVWLREGRWKGAAADVTGLENRIEIFRRLLVASGLAGPLFGLNPKTMTDADLERYLCTYRLVRIGRTEAVTGPDGPGDLAWIWPLATFILLGRLMLRPARARGN